MPPTVLVVTEREHVAAQLTQQLEQRQFSSVVAASDQLAARFADLDGSAVVLLDLALPDSSERLQAIERAHSLAAQSRAPVLAVLPHDARGEAAGVLAAGAADFVLEPIDFDELATRINVLAERSELVKQGGPVLELRLAGALQVCVDGRMVIDEHYPRRRAKALFAYLYLNRGRQISKYQLLAELWPEVENADAGRVKHTIQVLRATLEGPAPSGGWRFIHEHAGAYSFNADADRWCDMEEFDNHLAQARQAQRAGEQVAALTHYRRAIALRPAPFLAEFRYDDWAAADSARLQESFLLALDEAGRLEADRAAYGQAIELLRRAVAEDPLRESSYVELMRCLWLDGRRTDAVRVYHRMREILNKKLGVEPQTQT